MYPRSGPKDSRKIGIAGPPVETELGWLLLYHGISKKEDRHYHLRVALLDKSDPTKVIARIDDPILETEMAYEKNGVVPNVVFSCATVIVDDTVYVHYGGADTVIGVATISLSNLLKILVP